MTTESTGKTLHAVNPQWQVIVYNTSKSGVMTDIKFDNQDNAIGYYEHALYLGYHATLIELNPTN